MCTITAHFSHNESVIAKLGKGYKTFNETWIEPPVVHLEKLGYFQKSQALNTHKMRTVAGQSH